MKSNNVEEMSTQEEVMEELGITASELDDIDVEIE